MASIQQILLAYGASGTGDPYFGSVASLLHMDGTNASTTFTDVKGKTWTANGNAQIATAQSQFGGASGLFDGTGDYVNTSSHADFGFGSGDYTVEFWCRPSVVTGDHCIFDNRSGSNSGIGIYTSLSAFANKWGYADDTAANTAAVNLTANTWYHLVVCRQSSTLRLYTNGVQSATTSDSRTYAASTAPFIGTTYLAGAGYNGYIDDFRITKGVCRYPNGTTFSVPTAAFPDS